MGGGAVDLLKTSLAQYAGYDSERHPSGSGVYSFGRMTIVDATVVSGNACSCALELVLSAPRGPRLKLTVRPILASLGRAQKPNQKTLLLLNVLRQK